MCCFLVSSAAWAKPSHEELERAAVSDAAEVIPLPQTSPLLSPGIAVYGSSLYLSWLQRNDMSSGTLQVATWNGSAWSAPVAIAPSVALDVQQLGREPTLNRRPDGSLVVHWFDRFEDGVHAVVRGVGPVMAIGADGTGLVAYYSERRQGRPAVTCFVGPMKKFLTPNRVAGKDVFGFNHDLKIHPHFTIDLVRDLHAHFAPDGMPIISAIEAGYPTARRADDDDAPIRRLTPQPLAADARLLFAGAFRDRSYFAWTSGDALTIARTTLTQARSAPAAP